MSDELHWGGINGKSLLKAVVSDIWMVFAVMVITYICLGAAANLKSGPTYTSSAVVAVYPFNKMYTLEDSSNALGTVTAVNEVLNSDMFRTGLNERLTEPMDFSFSSRQIDGTYILMMSSSAAAPDIAYKSLRTALDYYGEISSHLVGDCQLEILTEPDFPTASYIDSKFLNHRNLLTLFMGFAMGCFLILIYAMRKTYKTSAAVRKYYKDVRFFRIPDPASEKFSLRNNKNKEGSGSGPDKEAVRKMAMELQQMLRAKDARSIFVTSAAPDEGKTEVTYSLARELENSGRSVIILETDPEKTEMQENAEPESDADIAEQDIRVIYAEKENTNDDFSEKTDIRRTLEQTEELADIVLVDGRVWTGSRDELDWKEAADASLVICRQDKADFYAFDRMMTDLRENDPDLLGCVLYGF